LTQVDAVLIAVCRRGDDNTLATRGHRFRANAANQMDHVADSNRLVGRQQSSGRKETQQRPAWLTEPGWFLWDGGFLLLGRSEGVVAVLAIGQG